MLQHSDTTSKYCPRGHNCLAVNWGSACHRIAGGCSGPEATRRCCCGGAFDTGSLTQQSRPISSAHQWNCSPRPPSLGAGFWICPASRWPGHVLLGLCGPSLWFGAVFRLKDSTVGRIAINPDRRRNACALCRLIFLSTCVQLFCPYGLNLSIFATVWPRQRASTEWGSWPDSAYCHRRREPAPFRNSSDSMLGLSPCLSFVVIFLYREYHRSEFGSEYYLKL